jgi:hypothetical protein
MFYPSKSFMYLVAEDGFTVYYDIDELAQFLEWYGYEAAAERLRQAIDPAGIVAIAGGNYVKDALLAKVGIASDIGWAYSSHTPVHFTVYTPIE